MKGKGSEEFSRRGFLIGAGKAAAAAAVGAVGLGSIANAADTPSWTYKEVDPEKVYWNGNANYYNFGCSQGAFDAMTKELGAPFSTIPGSIMRYGEGGVVGEGSHCGALNGSSAALSLAFGATPAVATSLIKELNAWYRQNLGHGSTLCHTSVTEWSKDNGVGVESQERKDRCARVCGETAKKAILLANAQLKGDFKAALTVNNPNTVPCITCHGSSAGGNATVRNGVAATDCTPCHETAHKSQ